MNNSATTLAYTSPRTSLPALDKPEHDTRLEEGEEYESLPHTSSSLPADEEVAVKQEVDYTGDAEATPVSRVPTRVSINDVKAIPNGGLLAWLQVLGAWMLFFDTWYVKNDIRPAQEARTLIYNKLQGHHQHVWCLSDILRIHFHHLHILGHFLDWLCASIPFTLCRRNDGTTI